MNIYSLVLRHLQQEQEREVDRFVNKFDMPTATWKDFPALVTALVASDFSRFFLSLFSWT